ARRNNSAFKAYHISSSTVNTPFQVHNQLKHSPRHWNKFGKRKIKSPLFKTYQRMMIVRADRMAARYQTKIKRMYVTPDVHDSSMTREFFISKTLSDEPFSSWEISHHHKVC